MQRSSEALGHVCRAVVQGHKAATGRGPVKVRAHYVDDMLIVICEGGLTTAERTMIDAGRHDEVREFRQAVDQEVMPTLADQIGQITGRAVRSHCSQVMFDPDRIIDIYALHPAITPGQPPSPQSSARA